MTKKAPNRGLKLMRYFFHTRKIRTEQWTEIAGMIRPDEWIVNAKIWPEAVLEKVRTVFDFFGSTSQAAGRKKFKKIKKTFEKGIAFFEKIEYNAEDVCKKG